MNSIPAKRDENSPTRYEIILLLLVISVTTLLRFYQLAIIPPGFHYDESIEAVEAIKVLADPTYRPIFFVGDFGISPVFIYLTAIAFKLFGAGPTVMRAVAAVVGSLTIPALFWLGKEMERLATRPLPFLGIASAGALATLYWHINFSRLGIEPILVPLVCVLSMAFFLRGLRTRRSLDMVFSGLLIGFAPYTYRAAFALPLLFIAFIVYCLLTRPSLIQGRGRSLLLLCVAAMVMLLPLIITFVNQPALLTLRNSQVSILGEGMGNESPLVSLWNNVVATAKSISFVGDVDPRNNLPGRPILDPILSVLFYVGLAAAIWRWREPAGVLALLWLGIMLAPTVLTEYAPQFRRAIGAAPAVALVIGYGVSAICQRVWEWRASMPSRRVVHMLPALAGVLLGMGYCGSVALAANDYFVKWANSPQLFYAFDVGLADIAGQIATESAKHTAYLSPRSVDHPTIAFFLGDSTPPHTFDGRDCIVLPPDDTPATYWIIDYEDWRGEQLILRHLPDATLDERIVDRDGNEYAVVYRQPADGVIQVDPDTQTAARFGDWAALQGWTVVNPEAMPGEVLYLDLYWESLAPAPASYTLFVHLLGDYNLATQGPVWAGADSLPGAGSYETTNWIPGERIIDEIQVQLPADLPAGEYQIEAGWYDLNTMQRVTVFEQDGQAEADHLVLGSITIGESP